jgi:simple sugar transport system substrate-binding protein
VISGIDTTEAVVVAGQKRKEGKKVWAIPYDYVGACKGGSEVCLGVPYFNWGPGYVGYIKASMSGEWKSNWLWLGPDWKNINNTKTSTVGGVKLEVFIKNLGSGKLNLFTGPMYYQDGSTFLNAGEVASDNKIWYMKQLLQGMTGQSSAK